MGLLWPDGDAELVARKGAMEIVCSIVFASMFLLSPLTLHRRVYDKYNKGIRVLDEGVMGRGLTLQSCACKVRCFFLCGSKLRCCFSVCHVALGRGALPIAPRKEKVTSHRSGRRGPEGLIYSAGWK